MGVWLHPCGGGGSVARRWENGGGWVVTLAILCTGRRMRLGVGGGKTLAVTCIMPMTVVYLYISSG